MPGVALDRQEGGGKEGESFSILSLFFAKPFLLSPPSLSLLATRQLHPSLIYLALGKFGRRISVSSPPPLGDYYYYYCGEEQKEENSICAVGNFVWGR